MTRRSELFRQLEPPPGGMALLRERLERRRQRRTWLLGVPAAAAAACVALVLGLRPPPPDPLRERLLADPMVYSLGLRPAQAQVAAGSGKTALAKVESGNPNVVVYWVDGQ
ncbi:MAG TPA: hypothetical protein VGK67_29360 [Myxococcales bacterium]|jgi:hypothetical protein